MRATTSGAFRCAPPSGSGMISSTMPKLRKSSAVNFNRAAASSALLASDQRIAAQPSGDATE